MYDSRMTLVVLLPHFVVQARRLLEIGTAGGHESIITEVNEVDRVII